MLMFPEVVSFSGNFLAAIDEAQEPNDLPCATAQRTNRDPRLKEKAAGMSKAESPPNRIKMSIAIAKATVSGNRQILKLEKILKKGFCFSSFKEGVNVIHVLTRSFVENNAVTAYPQDSEINPSAATSPPSDAPAIVYSRVESKDIRAKCGRVFGESKVPTRWNNEVSFAARLVRSSFSLEGCNTPASVSSMPSPLIPLYSFYARV